MCNFLFLIRFHSFIISLCALDLSNKNCTHGKWRNDLMSCNIFSSSYFDYYEYTQKRKYTQFDILITLQFCVPFTKISIRSFVFQFVIITVHFFHIAQIYLYFFIYVCVCVKRFLWTKQRGWKYFQLSFRVGFWNYSMAFWKTNKVLWRQRERKPFDMKSEFKNFVAFYCENSFVAQKNENK